MKNISKILIICLAAMSALTACKAEEIKPASSTTQISVTTTEAHDETEPDVTEEEVPYLPKETTNTSQTSLADIADDLGGNDADAEDLDDMDSELTTADSDISQIHLPAMTSSAENKVFLVCVDPETTSEQINAVISKYNLEVVYDYENFNMYALSVPKPLDGNETQSFIKELESTYDFILSVEPDSVVALDNTSVQ